MALSAFTVSLLGHSSNSDNLGLGALTVSEIAILRRIASERNLPLRIRIIDWAKDNKHYVEGDEIEIVEITRADVLNPRRLFRLFLQSDLVIDIGAGDSFADIYGAKRLRLMMAIKYLAHLARVPVVLAPQTMGPFQSFWGRRMALPHLKMCRAVFSRDDLSTRFLTDMGFRGTVVTASDVALILPYDPPAAREPGGPIRIGLNISGLLMKGGYKKTNEFGLKADYPELIRGIVEDFHAMPDVELHMIGHVLTNRVAVEDDYRAGVQLAKEYPGLKVAPFFETPSAAKSYIAGMDFFMGARMHATIAAFSSGVPVIPMAYSRKFRGLFGSLGFTRTVDCTTEETSVIREKIARGFAERDLVRTEVAAALVEGNQRLELYIHALSLLMGSIAEKRGHQAAPQPGTRHDVAGAPGTGHDTP